MTAPFTHPADLARLALVEEALGRHLSDDERRSALQATWDGIGPYQIARELRRKADALRLVRAE